LLAIASKAAAEPVANSGAYSVSKAAVSSLMRAFALELRDTRITANSVLPSTMDTPQNRTAMPDADPARWVHPCQVASLLVYLASDAAASVSGAALPIYGADL
jgi:NAD(P)-dependent dehydrogenase (short-subunit alcohol dehydrogenase family)